MNVLIDTCIWSAALRRREPDARVIQEITKLIAQGRVMMIGPIRQELLTGLRH